jgi:hypothetical protein
MNQLMANCAAKMADCLNINNPPTSIPGGNPPSPPGTFNKYSNDALTYLLCGKPATLGATDTLPGWITLDTATNIIHGSAGIFFGRTKEEANALANAEFVSNIQKLIATGIIFCNCISTGGTLPDGQSGVSGYDTFIVAAGAPPPGFAITFNVTAGTFPPGLTLNSSTGEITGTPTLDGIFAFTITLDLVPI